MKFFGGPKIPERPLNYGLCLYFILYIALKTEISNWINKLVRRVYTAKCILFPLPNEAKEVPRRSWNFGGSKSRPLSTIDKAEKYLASGHKSFTFLSRQNEAPFLQKAVNKPILNADPHLWPPLIILLC